jgi:hypothetical protein
MATARHAVKEKRTFSLSHDVVEYLEAGCAQTQAPSLSAYLEQIVRDFQSKVEMENLEAATLAYYDSLTTAEMEEQADWGRVGAATLVSADS